MPATSGYTSGSFTIPTTGHTATNVWYRIYLTVTDSVGLTQTSYVDIHPRTTNITLQTNPPGLHLLLDDLPTATPLTTGSVINVIRKFSAPLRQRANGKIWVFDHWSDGGAATHTISTPSIDSTYTAYYRDLGPFIEQGGQVTFEAEDYDDTVSRGSQAWIFRNGLPVFGGTGYMRADPDSGVSNLSPGYSSLSPELRYAVQFTTTGTYYIWVRLNAPATNGDTLHVGLDGAEIPSASNIRDNTLTDGVWIWTNTTVSGPVATLNITTPGVHTINAWMGEDGLHIDRFVLTTNSGFVPTDPGPAESPRGTGSVIYTTPTPAPSLTPTPAGPAFKLQYRTGDTVAIDSSVKPGFRILNQSSVAAPLSELTIRYYFTRDTNQALVFNCDYASFDCANVTGAFTTVSMAGADTYMEVGFTPAAGSVPANGSTFGIATRFNKADWSAFNENNDYSYDVTKTTYADWTKVTLYHNGVLVWGVEPAPVTATPASAPTFALPTPTP